MQHTNISLSKTTGQLIKEHRTLLDLTQEDLAALIEVDARTIRFWESKGAANIRRGNAEKLFQALGILPELLGLPQGLPQSYSPEIIENSFKSVKLLLDEGAFVSALRISSILENRFTKLVKSGKTHLLRQLNTAQYLTGHATSIVLNDARLANQHYQLMDQSADELKDQTSLHIARTYQAEMYRRMGKHDEAFQIMKSVLDTSKDAHQSETDLLVRGNSLQLLARIYIDREEPNAALRAMKKAEELLEQGFEQDGRFYICFNQCSTQIEYANMYARFGMFKKSFQHIEKARRLSDVAPRWSVPVKLTHAEVLIRAAADAEQGNAKVIRNEQDYYQAGLRELFDGYAIAKKYNHKRQMVRVQKLASKYARRGYLALEIAHDIEEGMDKIDRGITSGNDTETSS